MLQQTENRETQIWRRFEQAAFARTVESVQFYIAIGSVKDGNRLETGSSHRSRYKQFLPITQRSDQ